MGLNYERIMAYRPADIAVSYGARECILYALGIGMGMDPLDPGALKFVYERAGLEAFPTMAVVLGWPGRMTDPAFGVDERLVVAGDLKVVLHRGQAVRQTVGSAPELLGPAVNVAHRLLKNSIQSRLGYPAYVFVTDAAAAELGLTDAGLEHVEDYPDVGQVQGRVIEVRERSPGAAKDLPLVG